MFHFHFLCIRFTTRFSLDPPLYSWVHVAIIQISVPGICYSTHFIHYIIYATLNLFTLICLQQEIIIFCTFRLSLYLQGPSLMADVVTVAMLTRRILCEENDKVLLLYFCFWPLLLPSHFNGSDFLFYLNTITAEYKEQNFSLFAHFENSDFGHPFAFVHQALESPDRDQIDRYITSSVKSAFLKVTFVQQPLFHW